MHARTCQSRGMSAFLNQLRSGKPLVSLLTQDRGPGRQGPANRAKILKNPTQAFATSKALPAAFGAAIREDPEDGQSEAGEGLRGKEGAETAKKQESPLQDSKQDR